MKNDMAFKEKKIQILQNRVTELERQLAKTQAQEISKDAEGRLRSILDHLLEGCQIMGFDWRFLYINDVAAQYSRHTKEEILGRKTTEVFPGIELTEIYKAMKDCMENRVAVRRDFEFVFPDKTKKWFDVSIQPVPEGIFILSQEITERKRAEEALEASDRQHQEMARLLMLDRARLSAVLKHLPVGVWISDQEGRLIGKNEEADRIWAGNAPLSQRVEEYQQYSAWYPESGKILQPEEYPMAVALRTGLPVMPTELKIRRFDGSEGTVIVSAVPIWDDQASMMGVVAVNVDITDRQQAEEERRLAEERYATLFNSVKEGFAHYKALYGENGKVFDLLVKEINPAGAAIFGVPREEQIGKTWRQFWADVDDTLIAMYQRVDETAGNLRFDNHSHLTGKFYDVVISKIAPGEFIVSFNDITERKKAEEALRRSEERFAKAFHASPDAIIISRTSDGLIMEVNEGWRTIFGHEQSEVFGRTTVELGIYVDPEARTAAVRQLEETGLLRDFEINVRRKSGEIRQASFNGEQIEIDGVRCLLMVIRDVTDQKQAEEALRQSEERFAKAFHSSPDAIIISRMSDGLIMEVSEGWRGLFGHEPGEVIGHTSVELNLFINPVDRKEAIRRILEDGSVRNFELEIRHKSGEVRLASLSAEKIEVNGEISLLTVLRDITEQKQVEKALRESERRFRSLADSMPQLVWTALPDGQVDYYNQRYQEYQEIKHKEGADWEWAPVLHPDDLQATVDAWLESVETGITYQIEHRVRMADGSYRWHLSRGVPMLDEKGKVIRWFGTATDIHDLKLAEEQLKVYATRLEQSNRELEQFAFMASHDLQEPLRKIEMFGDLLLERASALAESERNYLNRMRGAAGRMRNMVEGLLQLSRVATQAKPFVQVDLGRVTSEVLDDFDELIQALGGRVKVGSLPTVFGDPLQLRQLMQNLIGNALKYHPLDKSPQVKIYSKTIAEGVQIYVEDQGIGFHQEDAERIFQPFQRLVGRSQYHGSGIGLAICRRIVERHGGEIFAISEPGQGTTFVVNLPNRPARNTMREKRKD